MIGLPVPVVDDIEWIRLQEEIKYEEVKQQKEEGNGRNEDER